MVLLALCVKNTKKRKRMANKSPSQKFKKGNNYGGRPKKSRDIQTIIDSLPESIRKELLTCKLTGQPITDIKQFWLISLLALAGEGNPQAVMELGNRIVGKVANEQIISGGLTERHELVEEIREGLKNGEAGAIADISTALRLVTDGTKPGDNGPDDESGQVADGTASRSA